MTEMCIRDRKETVLIVIDTLQCIRKQSLDYSYGTDYKDIQDVYKRQMYNNARRNEAVCQVNLFGILYAEELKNSGCTIKHIVELSGIQSGCLLYTSYSISNKRRELSCKQNIKFFF